MATRWQDAGAGAGGQRRGRRTQASQQKEAEKGPKRPSLSINAALTKPNAPLRDLTEELIKCGAYEEYKRFREGYRRWRKGGAKGAVGDYGARGGETRQYALADSFTVAEGPLLLGQSWRDDYRRWRAGNLRGASGRMLQEPDVSEMSESRGLPPIVFDVVVCAGGEAGLLPSDGPPIAPMAIQDFPKEAVLTIRVFRFFEDKADERTVWEKGLLNVNSGSLFWLPWQLEPNMHTKDGAKYGTWFTMHYVKVLAKHFKSAYHMCNEGYNSGAKTFGCSSVGPRAITGKAMAEGYFWYVSPAAGQEHLRHEGWQHLDCIGPFDGTAFLSLWRQYGSPLEARALQQVLARTVECPTRGCPGNV